MILIIVAQSTGASNCLLNSKLGHDGAALCAQARGHSQRCRCWARLSCPDFLTSTICTATQGKEESIWPVTVTVQMRYDASYHVPRNPSTPQTLSRASACCFASGSCLHLPLPRSCQILISLSSISDKLRYKFFGYTQQVTGIPCFLTQSTAATLAQF